VVYPLAGYVRNVGMLELTQFCSFDPQFSVPVFSSVFFADPVFALAEFAVEPKKFIFKSYSDEEMKWTCPPHFL
jgi:hypothetical protein